MTEEPVRFRIARPIRRMKMDEMNMILDKHLSRIAGMTSLIEEQLEATRILIDKGISKTLSKREMIAAMVMSAWIPSLEPLELGDAEKAEVFVFKMVKASVQMADAMLHELDQTKG